MAGISAALAGPGAGPTQGTRPLPRALGEVSDNIFIEEEKKVFFLIDWLFHLNCKVFKS